MQALRGDPHRAVWANRRVAPLARGGFDQEQDTEADCGKEAREAGTIVEGFGNHCLRSHGQQCSGSERLQVWRPGLI